MQEANPSTEFLGTTLHDKFTVNKQYLEGEGNQLRIYHTRYTPKQAPVATVCIIHGFAEYSGRYKHIAEFFVAKNYVVLLIDLRGFGYSGGARGCAQVDQMQRDIILAIKQASDDLPLFIYAHSLGAILTISLLIDYPFLNVSAVILTSPFLGFPEGKGFGVVKTFALKHFGLQLEDFVINSMINPTALTKKNKEVANIFGDRLMIPFLSIRMARSIIMTIDKIFARASAFRTPILAFHGKNDTVANYKATVKFMDKVGSRKKYLKIFDDGYHELQNDQECPEMLSMIDNWLNEVEKRPLTVLNLNRASEKRPWINWKWLVALVYFLIVIHVAKYKKPNTSILKVLFSPLLLLLRRY